MDLTSLFGIFGGGAAGGATVKMLEDNDTLKPLFGQIKILGSSLQDFLSGLFMNIFSALGFISKDMAPARQLIADTINNSADKIKAVAQSVGIASDNLVGFVKDASQKAVDASFGAMGLPKDGIGIAVEIAKLQQKLTIQFEGEIVSKYPNFSNDKAAEVATQMACAVTGLSHDQAASIQDLQDFTSNDAQMATRRIAALPPTAGVGGLLFKANNAVQNGGSFTDAALTMDSTAAQRSLQLADAGHGGNNAGDPPAPGSTPPGAAKPPAKNTGRG